MPKLSYSCFLLNKRHLPYDSFISKFSKMSWKTPRQIQSWLVSYLFNDMLIRFQYQDALYVNVHFWKFTIQLVVTARQSHEDWRILNPGSRDQTRIGRLQQKYALLGGSEPPRRRSFGKTIRHRHLPDISQTTQPIFCFYSHLCSPFWEN